MIPQKPVRRRPPDLDVEIIQIWRTLSGDGQFSPRVQPTFWPPANSYMASVVPLFTGWFTPSRGTMGSSDAIWVRAACGSFSEGWVVFPTPPHFVGDKQLICLLYPPLRIRFPRRRHSCLGRLTRVSRTRRPPRDTARRLAHVARPSRTVPDYGRPSTLHRLSAH